MISFGPTETWSPPWLIDEATGKARRSYIFRVGEVMERARVEADLAGECRAGSVFAFQFDDAFADGVRALLPDNLDEAERLIELQRSARQLTFGDKLPADEAAQLDMVQQTLTEAWPAYGALVAQEERRNQFAPIIAFRRLCVGWEEATPSPTGEGEGGEEELPLVLPTFTRGVDGLVTLAAMAKVPPLELRAGGAFAFNLLYGGGSAGNFARPSKLDGGRATSTSGTAKAAGKSTAKNGPKTRSSRSPRGRSKPSTSG